MRGIKGKITLITGGTRGIGKGIAKRFLEEGAIVIVVGGKNRQDAENTVAELSPLGQIEYMMVDLSGTEAVEKMIDDVVAKYGRIDILVNDAGIQVRKWATEFPIEDFDRVLGLNLLEAAEKASAVVAGCGLGHPERWTELLGALRRRCLCPLVLDADGINAITPHMLLEDTASAPLILTPHPGEMARLLDTSTGAVQKRREEIARRFADSYGVTLARKGHHTLVTAPGQPLWCNPTGNPGMAAGGSGDVLAGMIGSLAAQGLAPLEAAACGVWLHGAAGDAAAARRSQHSMLPSDLVEELGGLFLKFEK